MNQGEQPPGPDQQADTTAVSTRAVISPGSVVSNTYRVNRTIAAGGMGVVFEAEHLRLGGHRVALKVMLPEATSNPETIARFRREAEICTRLQHPGIVRVTDFNVLDDGTPYLVMDYLEGESLDIRMSRGPMSREDAFAIIRQIGGTLDWAHAQGIVHRDLKPSNVFLTRTVPPSVTVKILDFGISKVLTERTLHAGEEAKVIGSPRYMSPEQAEGRNQDVGPASDQFSLASIACELLTGQKAFPGETPAAVLYRVVHGDPMGLDILGRSFPPGVVNAIRRALAKHPAHRHASVGAFLQALDSGTTRTLEMVPPSLLKKRSRGRWSSALALLFILATLGVAVYFLVMDLSQEKQDSRWKKPGSSSIKPRSTFTQQSVADPIKSEEEGGGDDRQPALVPPKVEPTKEEIIDHRADGILDGARTKYDQRQYEEAIRLAKESIGIKPSGRAHVLITLSYCSLGDASAARQALAGVPAPRRRDTILQCRHLGLDLEDGSGKADPGKTPPKPAPPPPTQPTDESAKGI